MRKSNINLNHQLKKINLKTHRISLNKKIRKSINISLFENSSPKFKNISTDKKSVFYRKSNVNINNTKLKLPKKAKYPECIQNYEKFLKTTYENSISNKNLESEDIFKIEQSQNLVNNPFLKSHYHLQLLSNTPSKIIFDYFGSLKSSYYDLYWAMENDKKYSPPDSSFLKSNFKKLKAKNLNFNDLDTMVSKFGSVQRKKTNEFLHEYDNQNMIKEAFYDFNFEIKLMENLFDVKIKDKHIKHKHEHQPIKLDSVPSNSKISERIEIYSNIKDPQSGTNSSNFVFDSKVPHTNDNNFEDKELAKNETYQNKHPNHPSIIEKNDQNENIPENRTVYSFKDNMTYTPTINQDEYHMVKVGSMSELHMSQFDYVDSIITGKKSIFVDVSTYHK